MKRIIAPSLLAADFLNLEAEMNKIESTNCQWLHLDVMDGNFVPNVTFGYDLISRLRAHSTKVFDVHLMITNPRDYVEKYQKAGADYFTFHYEAVAEEEISDLIKEVKSTGMKVGISIKPNTDVSAIEKYLSDLDLVLVMSVEPGFGGQSFMPNSVDKIKKLSELKIENNYEYLIEVDGGINADTYSVVSEAGCEVLVAGSYVFNGDIQEKIDTLRS